MEIKKVESMARKRAKVDDKQLEVVKAVWAKKCPIPKE